MILTCTECHTRYLLPTHLLGADGRRVRCTICAHEWFQVPEEDEIPVDDESDSAFHKMLLDSVKEEGPAPLPAAKESKIKLKWAKADTAGFLAAIVVGALLFGGLVAAREPVQSLWPSSVAVYELLGFKASVAGEGLVFEKLSATTSYNAEGIEILRVSGEVVNIKGEAVAVPGVKFSLLNGHGEEVDSWSYPSEGAQLEAGASAPFGTTYPKLGEDVKEVNIHFVME